MLPFIRLASWCLPAGLAALCWGAFFCYPGAWVLAAFGSVAAFLALVWGAYIVLDMYRDIAMREAEHRRVMTESNYRRELVEYVENEGTPDERVVKRRWEWAWNDDNGNGRVDPGEIRPQVVTIRQAAADKGDPGFTACLDVLNWAYEQEAAGLSWGQRAGCDHFGQSRYEYAMAVLKTMHLVEDRRKGKQGALVYPDAASAIAVLRDKWQRGGGYVKTPAY